MVLVGIACGGARVAVCMSKHLLNINAVLRVGVLQCRKVCIV